VTPEPAPSSSLRVVTAPKDDRPQQIFCGHCGRRPEEESASASRVCPRCGMGLLLQAPTDVVPKTNDPFLVVDGSLNVCAVSRLAEKMLGISETEAVNRHIGELLVPGDSEAPASENLGPVLQWAARGDAPAQSIVVRPANTFGVRYWARIGPCGPPQAALLVLADAR
jgi:PAS domain-containing protein